MNNWATWLQWRMLPNLSGHLAPAWGGKPNRHCVKAAEEGERDEREIMDGAAGVDWTDSWEEERRERRAIRGMKQWRRGSESRKTPTIQPSALQQSTKACSTCLCVSYVCRCVSVGVYCGAKLRARNYCYKIHNLNSTVVTAGRFKSSYFLFFWSPK